jgi:hypothetical protein
LLPVESINPFIHRSRTIAYIDHQCTTQLDGSAPIYLLVVPLSARTLSSEQEGVRRFGGEERRFETCWTQPFARRSTLV